MPLRTKLTPIAVALCALLITSVVCIEYQKIVDAKIESRVKSEIDYFTTRITQHFQAYEQILLGTVGLFCSSEKVSEEEWHTYYRSLNIQKNWPGIQAVGFAEKIDLTQEIGKLHFIDPKHVVRPSLKESQQAGREAASVISYISPADWRNQRAVGYDMWSQETRREALLTSWKKRVTAMSGAVTLVQETKEDIQVGFLTYLPLFLPCESQNLEVEKEPEFIGWIYAAFRAGDFLSEIDKRIRNNSKVDYKVWVIGDEERSLLFSSNRNKPQKQNYSRFDQESFLNIDGQEWLIEFDISDSFLTSAEKKGVYLIGLSGLIISLFLYFFLKNLVSLREKAEALVIKRTSQLAELNSELEEANILLQDKNTDLDSFVRVTCHDLKAPLRAINNVSQWLSEDCKETLSKAGKDYIDEIVKRASYMSRLIDDLLSLSRAGEGVDSYEKINIAELLENLNGILAVPKGFTIVGPPGEVVFIGPRVSLEQILRNLIQNAINHHHKDQGQITINAKLGSHSVDFSVEDDGPGVPVEYRELIFEVSKRLPREQKSTGTGMGLAIVKKLVQSNGGEIYVKDSATGGAEFCFDLRLDLSDQTI